MALVEIVAMEVDEVAMEIDEDDYSLLVDDEDVDYDSDDSVDEESNLEGIAMEMMKLLRSHDKAQKQIVLLESRLHRLKRRMTHAELTENYPVHESSKHQHDITSEIRELYDRYRLNKWTRVQRMASSMMNQVTGQGVTSQESDSDIINDMTDQHEDTLDYNCDTLFNQRDVKPDIQLSKSLSWLLRHAAEKCGFKLMPGGFLYVDEVLKHPRFSRFTQDDIQRVVSTNEKQRFATEREGGSGRLKIRANQGHSVHVDQLDLVPIVDPEDAPIVAHGTYLRAWQHIQTQGLKRMNRTHIHFAPGVPGASEVISGMRSSCQVLVFIDFKKALEANLKFFRSANNVILSSGDQNGCILPYLFNKVIQIRPKQQELSFDRSIGADATHTEAADSLDEDEKHVVTVVDSLDKQHLLLRHLAPVTDKEALGVMCLFANSDDDTPVPDRSVSIVALALRNQCIICDLITCPELISQEGSSLREQLESKSFIKVYTGPEQMGTLFSKYQVLVSHTPLCDVKSAYHTWLNEKEAVLLSTEAFQSLSLPVIATKLGLTYEPGLIVNDWMSRPLTSEMITYASVEAYSLIRLHKVFTDSRVNISAVTKHTFESLNQIIDTNLARQLYKQRKQQNKTDPD